MKVYFPESLDLVVLKRLLLLLWLSNIVLCAYGSGPIVGWTSYASGETGSPTLEFSVATHSQDGAGVFASPVVSDPQGNIYLSYMDLSQTVRVVKKDASGQTTNSAIETNSPIDYDHFNSSLGIDKYGYLHVVWGMHNSVWKYKVSTAPYDITNWNDIGPLANDDGSLHNVRGIPGQEISYASFFKDAKNDLYVAFRFRGSSAWVAGSAAGGLARYAANANALNGRWSMLGGTSCGVGDPCHASATSNQLWGGKTLIWTGQNGVTGDEAYQSYLISHYAGHDGSIHIAFAFNISTAVSWDVNTFGYATSTDQGVTWKRSSGTVFSSLPMMDTNYDAVISNAGSNIWYQAPWVHVGADGLPVVSALNDSRGTEQWWHRSGSTWSISNIGNGGGPGRIIADGYGRIYNFGSGTLYYKNAGDTNWTQITITASPWEVHPDYDYLFSTANVRYMDFSGGNKRVYTLKFPGHIWKAPVTTCPTSLTFDGQPGGRQIASLAGLIWDQDWYCSAGNIYLYSSAGSPSVRWTQGGVAAVGGTPSPTPTATATATGTPIPTPSPSSTPSPTPLGLSFPATAGIITSPFVISNNSVSQPIETDDPTQGGRAFYSFNVPASGDYQLAGLVNCPDGASNSVFVNVDAEPTAGMIWHIPLTSGFELRIASWPPNTAPKVWSLSAGIHQLIIRGREANTLLRQFTFSIPPQPPTGLHVVP